uniref:Serpin family E member 2 n=1 Tax=Oncorhynchus kisutch TaxID=8019 RepID=A0A8C7HFP4_ONCKI
MGLPSLLCMCVLVTLGGHRGVISQAPSTPSYGERGSDLGLQVFQQVARSRPQENVVLSPHGVASILGMLLPGAHGETRRQLLTALRYKKNGPYKMLKKLHKMLTAKSNQDIVTIANAMFSQQGFPMEEAFMSSNRANFQCESRTLDFIDTQAAAATINIWVNNKTKGHIPTLVKADMLDGALTRLVAVNAIYFKGLWKSRFQTENTKMRTFNAGDGNSYKVPMMSQLSVFKIGLASTPQGLNYKVIELPYHGNSISMLIALPSEEDTPLGDVIAHISTATVQSWTKLLHQRKVRLLLPKFTAEAEVDLQASLSALGITILFDEGKADFRHLSTEPVYISKALQKAKIEINEDGTKAAAVTTAILMARSSPPWIIVDRPFLFLIRHNPTGTACCLSVNLSFFYYF